MMVRTLPFVLSVIAGASDIIGVLGFDGLFTAHMIGMERGADVRRARL
jgi:uncharacterized membrane protein YoaK (UPF0700 family)